MNEENLIIIRSVFGKVGQKYILNPTVDPATNSFPDHIRSVDAHGDMILSEKDKLAMSENKKIFIKNTEEIVVEDGTIFNMNNKLDAARWNAIKHNKLIVEDRFVTDSEGNPIIDGSKTKYGIAELYVDKPGKQAEMAFNKNKLINDAQQHVYSNCSDLAKQKNMIKLLGKNMDRSPAADINMYLLDEAKRSPNKIIDLYSGTTTELRLLLLDAMNKKVVKFNDGIYYYDAIALGTNEEAVITKFQNETFSEFLTAIKQATYPDAYPVTTSINKPGK